MRRNVCARACVRACVCACLSGWLSVCDVTANAIRTLLAQDKMSGLCEDSVAARRDTLVSLLQARRIPFKRVNGSVDGSSDGKEGMVGENRGMALLLMEGLCRVEPPYTPSSCYCSNAMVLERVCALLQELQVASAYHASRSDTR